MTSIHFFIQNFKGGTARGKAFGNVYDWGDEMMTEPPVLHQKGLVYLYFSNKNPSSIIPLQSPYTMKTSTKVFHSTKPFFENLAEKFPDITNKGMLLFFFYIFSTYFNLFNHRIRDSHLRLHMDSFGSLSCNHFSGWR